MRFFGHKRPIRNGSEIIGSIESPVKVKTVEALGSGYGPDSDKRLVFTAHGQDLIGVRPERTGRELFICAKDLYAQLLRRWVEADRRQRRAARKARRK